MLASEEPLLITADGLLWLGLLPGPAGEPPDPRARLALALGGEARDFEVRVEVAPDPGTDLGEPGHWRLSLRPDGPAFDLARRPFHRSPGRWHLHCPVCGRWRAALALVPPTGTKSSPGVPTSLAGATWACRKCLGLPAPAQRLSHRQRLVQALERAEDVPMRRHNESHQRWLRRLARAEVAERRANQLAGRAEESFGAQVARLAAPTADDSDNSPSNSESSARVARKTDLPGEGS